MLTRCIVKNCTENFRLACTLNNNSSIQIAAISTRNYSQRAYFQQLGSEPLIYRNLGQQVQRAVEQHGKQIAIISCHEDKRLTFEEVKSEAEKLAIRLQDLGLNKGDHLGIWATNSTQWYISMVAAALAGFPLVCLNPALQAQEIEYALKKAKVKALITMEKSGKQNFYEILKVVLKNDKTNADGLIEATNLPHLQRILIKSNEASNEFINYNELMSEPARSQDVAYLNYKIKTIPAESLCNIQFTSGTTGQPKAALLTHFNFVNEGYYFGRAMKLHESHKHICLPLPLFHVFGLGVAISALEYGSTLVLPSASFNGAAVLEAIEKENCNIILGTPTMYVDMLEQQRVMKKCVHSLELGMVGGAACSPQVFEQTKMVFNLKEKRIAYGLSEATAAIFAQDGTESLDNAVHTVGRIFEHGEAKVIDDKGQTVAFGEPGELCVRGFFTMRGYYEDEDKTKEVFTEDRWLKTGDKFILEPSGIGRIIGRKKDVLIRGGENIYPKEVEDFLDRHKDILEAQIIGVPDERMGEEICAYLRLRPDAFALTDVDIRNFCKGKIAHFKIPRYVRIIKDFPKTNSGKIQKFKLREAFQKE